MYPHCLSEYHLCIDDQGNLSDPRCNRYCEYVGCNLCGRRCYGDCSFECNPGVVCKKSVEMILLVYSVITGSSLKPIFRSFGHSTGAGKNPISSNMADSSCAEKAEAGTKPAFGRELSAYL